MNFLNTWADILEAYSKLILFNDISQVKEKLQKKLKMKKGSLYENNLSNEAKTVKRVCNSRFSVYVGKQHHNTVS